MHLTKIPFSCVHLNKVKTTGVTFEFRASMFIYLNIQSWQRSNEKFALECVFAPKIYDLPPTDVSAASGFKTDVSALLTPDRGVSADGRIILVLKYLARCWVDNRF